MSELSPVELVYKSFDYLFDVNGFKLADEKRYGSFGDWAVVLQVEGNCRIRIYTELGEVNISFGPTWEPAGWEAGPWYNIKVVLFDLGQKIEKSPSYKDLDSIKSQLDSFSQIIRPLLSQICDLFKSNHYENNRNELDIIKNKFEYEIYNKYKG